LAETISNVFEAKYLAVTSYTVDLEYPKNQISVCKRLAKTFDYCRCLIILRTRSYLLGHWSYARLLQTWLARTLIYRRSQTKNWNGGPCIYRVSETTCTPLLSRKQSILEKNISDKSGGVLNNPIQW